MLGCLFVEDGDVIILEKRFVLKYRVRVDRDSLFFKENFGVGSGRCWFRGG